MARVAMRALLLSGALGLAQGSSEVELRQAIVELQTMIGDQKARINSLEMEEDPKRRLDSRTPSIYADQASTRPYTDQESLNGCLDHLWVIICGALVMFMQAGFAMVESGNCRFKNVQNVLLKNLTDVCVGTLGWFVFGWSFAFSGPFDSDGKKLNGFIGYEQFAGHTFLKTRADGQIEPSLNLLNWFFQWAFCSAAATIVSGGVAERVNFPGYTIFSFLMTSFIYPIVVAWTWGGGYLSTMNRVGFFDFAGSGIVHMTGGVGALAGAAIAGPRKDRFAGLSAVQRIRTTPEAFNPHSLPLIVLGTFILWFGWYGFNCGSTLGMHNIETGFLAAQVAMNTTIAAATGGLFVFFFRYCLLGRFDVGGFCNGILAGLVSITAGCANMEAGSAFATAIVGAIVYTVSSALLRVCKVDDVVDAFPVHGACGAWGVLAAAFFDWGQGTRYVAAANGFRCMTSETGRCAGWAHNMGPDLIAAAFSEVACIACWAGGTSMFIFAILKMLGFLVASNDLQEQGFDFTKHSPQKAYEMDDMPKTSI